MAFGFPARFTESRTFNLPQDELIAIVKAALETLGWSYKVLWGKDYLAYPPYPAWSWGEELSVKILPDGQMQAQSKCIIFRQLFDFGRNRKNVETFFAQVEQLKGR